ncbi:MAG: hypothetical protein KAS78_02545, partial [Candidatus Pacebacteria bacterium]|nr:hypothetical protein [Candidatus Paceibacterota bacterium]
GNLTHTNGDMAGGQINLAGNYIIGANADGAPAGNDTATKINFNHATNDQTITYTASGIGAHVRIDKAGGTFSITNNIIVAGWTYITGTVIGVDTHTITFRDDSHGTFTPGSLAYNNITINKSATYDDLHISSGTLDINGNLIITNGDVFLNTYNPNINLAGNFSIASIATFTKGSGTLTFDGSTASTFTDSSATPQDIGSVVINKTGESLTLLSNTSITTLAVSGTSTLILGADLTVSGNTAINDGATLTYTQGTAADLTVNGTLTVYSGGTITTPYTSLTVPDSGGSGRTITAGNIDIQDGGTINADDKGFGVNAGPGKGAYFDGGSYGGRGGDYSANSTVGATYGSLTNPVSLGSGGYLIAGGGAIIISSTGTVTVNGTLSASGVTGNGGGSGGTINIAVDTLAGSGTIKANGYGNGSTGVAGSGGGRISVVQTTGTSWTPTFQAFGGNSFTASIKGAAGTIYLEDANDTTGAGELIIDNNNISTTIGTDTDISSSVTDTTVGSIALTASKAGRLTIASGQTLTTIGTSTTLNIGSGTTLTNNGTLSLGGTTFTKTGTYTAATTSTTTYIGQTDNSAVILLNAAHGNLTLNKTGTTFNLPADNFDVNGNLTITAGTLDATATPYNINLAGNWSNSGTFTPRSGTVTLDGTSQSILGNTTFYNLTKNVTSADTLTFGNSTTQIITGTMDLQGASGNLLSLRSDSTPTQWNIDPQGTRTISYLDVKDSNNINASQIIVEGFNITDSDNNDGWLFNVAST